MHAPSITPRPKTSKPARSPWPAWIRTSTANPDVCAIYQFALWQRAEFLLGEGRGSDQ